MMMMISEVKYTRILVKQTQNILANIHKMQYIIQKPV